MLHPGHVHGLESSLDRLDDAARASLGEDADFLLRFRGFDFTDSYEHRLAMFAKHLIDSDKWTTLAHHSDERHEDHEDGNSHMPMLDSYRRALTAYKTVLQSRKNTSRSPFEAYRFDVVVVVRVGRLRSRRGRFWKRGPVAGAASLPAFRGPTAVLDGRPFVPWFSPAVVTYRCPLPFSFYRTPLLPASSSQPSPHPPARSSASVPPPHY